MREQRRGTEEEKPAADSRGPVTAGRGKPAGGPSLSFRGAAPGAGRGGHEGGLRDGPGEPRPWARGGAGRAASRARDFPRIPRSRVPCQHGFQYSKAILVENELFLSELQAFARARRSCRRPLHSCSLTRRRRPSRCVRAGSVSTAATSPPWGILPKGFIFPNIPTASIPALGTTENRDLLSSVNSSRARSEPSPGAPRSPRPATTAACPAGAASTAWTRRAG
ncbi:uncharacterized protein LOC128788496 [Vidua chalybeata]|uniref:uncharacterized protein LOC128788496 n=1 Tax=Vidua chalybeata TaxID=81927 RepID=UPI0023A8B9B1|nr:uncharacterized protein LOC128788496 [Vidua chalybeata]